MSSAGVPRFVTLSKLGHLRVSLGQIFHERLQRVCKTQDKYARGSLSFSYDYHYVVVVFTLKTVPISAQKSSNIRTGPTEANAFRGHRLSTQKGYIL